MNALPSLDRRHFLRTIGATAAVAVSGAPALAAPPREEVLPPPKRVPRPAEGLIRELHSTLTAEQRQRLTLPFDHRFRQQIFNGPMNVRIDQVYTQAQQELLQRIMRAISSGEEGYRQLARNGSWEQGGGFGGCGANFFGDVATEGRQWAWVFSCHHLTVRCDGDSEPDAAFGGPMYYGHGADGHTRQNVFNYQTRAVNSVYDALSEAQRRNAVIVGNNPGEGAASIRFRREHPGLRAASLTADQRGLVETVMREVLSPYRREDADEVMSLIKRNGGLDQLHLAFYRDQGVTDAMRWHFWRIEGPGFVWNYRVMPHVHCYVNIARAPKG
jgi:hypothetical protein